MPVATRSCQAFPSATGLTVAGSLAGRASSPANRSLTYSLVTPPKAGQVALAANGEFTYTRSSAARGDVDTFVYRVTDTAGLTAEASADLIYGQRRIMPLGDSITDGVETFDRNDDGPPTAVRVGYRKVLRDRLRQENYAVDFVGSLSSGTAAELTDPQHEGHGGFTQQNIVERVDTWLTQNPADVVLLHIGTNDVLGVSTNAAPTAAPTGSILANIDAWTSVAGRPPVNLLVAEIISRRRAASAPADVEVERFNSDLASRYRANWAETAAHPNLVVSLVDMNARLDNTSSDMTPPSLDVSGLHPSPAGYAKMGNAWFDFLVQTGAVNKCP
jgi:lysophospholipase L1-like esterase